MNDVGLDVLIGDKELFRHVLDGFFRDWQGIYDILPYGSDEYVFYPKEHFCRLCRTLRSREGGDRLCFESDKRWAAEAAATGSPIHYLCPLGLIDIAAPVIVNHRPLATVFCGQRKPWRAADEQQAKEAILRVEEELKLELMSLWEEVVPIEADEVAGIKRRLMDLTRYLAHEWGEKLELHQARRRLDYHVRESEAVMAAFVRLGEVPLSEDTFWSHLSQILVDICEQFEAEYGAFLEISQDDNSRLAATANMPESLLNKEYSNNDEEVASWLLATQHPRVIAFDASCGMLYQDLSALNPDGSPPDEVALWPLPLGERTRGILCLFLHSDTETIHSLSIASELEILMPFLGQISSAYETCKLIEQERKLIELQSTWLQDVVHEVEQPINGILGYAELWHGDLKDLLTHWPDSICKLTRDYIEVMVNELESIEWMSINASVVARNFVWIAQGPDAISLSLEVDNDLSGTLIATARDKQGQARERKLGRVHVEARRVRPFNGRVRIDRYQFKQAMRNLLDNAVKYADEGTKVTVDALEEDGFMVLRVTNVGLPILPGEEELIFRRHERSAAARASRVGGAGIGLAITREILTLHNGTVRTSPSRRIEGQEGFETTFEVRLPVI